MTSYKLSYLRSRPRRQKPDARIKQELRTNEWDFRMNDLVEVTNGPDAGVRGRVIGRNARYNEITVEGVNAETKEIYDTESSPFRPKFEQKTTHEPIYFRDVALVCPTLDKRTAVAWETRDGRRVRVSTESGAEIPLPAKPNSWEGRDYAESLCTRRADVLEVTYKPLPDYSLTQLRLQQQQQQQQLGSAGEEPPAASSSDADGDGSRKT